MSHKNCDAFPLQENVLFGAFQILKMPLTSSFPLLKTKHAKQKPTKTPNKNKNAIQRKQSTRIGQMAYFLKTNWSSLFIRNWTMICPCGTGNIFLTKANTCSQKYLYYFSRSNYILPYDVLKYLLQWEFCESYQSQNFFQLYTFSLAELQVFYLFFFK